MLIIAIPDTETLI